MAFRTNRGGKVFFLAEATRNRGALTDYVYNVYGREGFVKRKGRWAIKENVVRDLARGKCPVCRKKACVCPSARTRKRAQLALTLRKINERRYR